MKLPVYHRQRFLLALLEAAGESLSRMDLQKLTFLYEQEHGTGHFAFIPYHYGAYSFQCADDLDLLDKRGWISLDEQKADLLQALPRDAVDDEVRSGLKKWLQTHPERGDDLVRKSYLAHPFSARNSKMKSRVLTADELRSVNETARVRSPEPSSVQTIGYEGIAFETYVNRLIQNGTSTLCDVRSNPHSRKFGFSKDSLSRILPRIGINYEHQPELGIVSSKRRTLETRQDYEELFEEYRGSLSERTEALEKLCDTVESNQATALTCFEADAAFCHRNCLSDWLEREKKYPVTHL